MAAEISDRVREIAETHGLPESEVFERALERGLQDLWEEPVLAQYLDGELEREDAIERVGRTKVERAERERDIVEEDVEYLADRQRGFGSAEDVRPTFGVERVDGVPVAVEVSELVDVRFEGRLDRLAGVLVELATLRLELVA